MLVVAIIVLVIIVLIVRSRSEEAERASTPPSPPSDDVWVLGCQGPGVDCGYGSFDIYKDSRGELCLNNKVIYCKYQGKTVRAGSQCPFAKEHPDLLTKGCFCNDNDMDFLNPQK